MQRKASLKTLRNRAWQLLSQIIRRSSANLHGQAVCYTCGRVAPWQELDCGHAIPGRRNRVLLEEKILRVQCKRCNIFLSGNYSRFIPKLIREIGLEEYERIEEESRKAHKITYGQYLDSIESYKERLNALNQAEP